MAIVERKTPRLSKPVLQAHGTIVQATFAGFMAHDRLIQIAQTIQPTYQRHEESWLIVQSTDWGNGETPTKASAGAFGLAGYSSAKLLMVMLRAERQKAEMHSLLRITFRLWLRVTNATGHVASIDAETGEIVLPRGWSANAGGGR